MNEEPKSLQLGNRIIGLDGFRAIAVTLVVAFHLFPLAITGGFLGVDIFFVISGFLITFLLIRERNEKNYIHLAKFWMGRIRRLIPALVLTVIVSLALAFLLGGDVLVGIARQTIGALTFSYNWVEISVNSNYFDLRTPHLFTHFWSLAIEEQFYLIWPLLLGFILFVFSVRRRYSVGIFITLAVALLSSLLMAILYNDGNATRVYYGTDTHLFGLMLGAALAFLSNNITRNRTSRAVLSFITQRRWTGLLGWTAIAGLLSLAFLLTPLSPFTYRGGLLLASLLTAVAIFVAAYHKGSLRFVLSLSPIVWIGVRSYGIYLWHWPLLVLTKLALPVTTPVWVIAVIIITLTLVIAQLSYAYLEMPIRKNGFRAYFAKLFRPKITEGVRKYKGVWVRSIASCAVILLAIGAIITAPTQTIAQQQIIEGQKAINKDIVSTVKPVIKPQPEENTPAKPTTPPTENSTISGTEIIIIGDSVTLSAAPQLQARYPGITIDAQISRAFRTGGMSDIQARIDNGTMPRVVIIAMATNGYFGNGNLNKVIVSLEGHEIIFVTVYAQEEWTTGNNIAVRQAAEQYSNVHVAPWDELISQHPEYLSTDQVHPAGAPGEMLYVDAISQALNQIHN